MKAIGYKVMQYGRMWDGTLFKHMDSGLICRKMGNSHARVAWGPDQGKDIIPALGDACIVYPPASTR
jgi:hypothetical protein